MIDGSWGGAKDEGTGAAQLPEYAGLLTLYEQICGNLQQILDQLKAPETQAMAREVRRRTGDPAGTLEGALSAVEVALRTLNVSGSEVRLALGSVGEAPVTEEGLPPMPPALTRFLAIRRTQPGFRYEVKQDEVRGWVIAWKELAEDGTVRGAGQFYERPYAWLED